MKRSLLAFCLAGLLAGCAGPVDLWYKPGVPRGASSSLLLQCRVTASQQVPANTQYATTPVQVIPGRTVCRNSGNVTKCYQSGGYVTGGETYSFDANAPLRDNVVAQCMNMQGYQAVELRRCEDKDLKGGVQDYTILPPLQPNACVVERGEGYFIVVNPPTPG